MGPKLEDEITFGDKKITTVIYIHAARFRQNSIDLECREYGAAGRPH